MSTKTYCLTLDIEGALSQPDKNLEGLVNDDNGNPLSAQELRKICKEKKAEGFKVLPMCDNHNEDGYCQGHPGMISFGGGRAGGKSYMQLAMKRRNWMINR